jgi:hypothetical protein
LVKDGATAIETLGDAIDASLVDLKGGTTGQVLAKNSGTDMDFTWTAIDPLVILDAKGDLITATAADTPARLAVGTNGHVLTADSTASTGLAWAAPSSGGMTLISTTTLSGSSVTLSSIPQTYVRLIVYVYAATNNTANGKLFIKPNDGANSRYSGTERASVYSSGGAAIQTNDTVDRTNSDCGWVMIIDNYTSTDDFTVGFHLDGYWNSGSGNGATAMNIAGTTATTNGVSYIVISNAGGTFSGGTVKLYGVK